MSFYSTLPFEQNLIEAIHPWTAYSSVATEPPYENSNLPGPQWFVGDDETAYDYMAVADTSGGDIYQETIYTRLPVGVDPYDPGLYPPQLYGVHDDAGPQLSPRMNEHAQVFVNDDPHIIRSINSQQPAPYLTLVPTSPSLQGYLTNQSLPSETSPYTALYMITNPQVITDFPLYEQDPHYVLQGTNNISTTDISSNATPHPSYLPYPNYQNGQDLSEYLPWPQTPYTAQVHQDSQLFFEAHPGRHTPSESSTPPELTIESHTSSSPPSTPETNPHTFLGANQFGAPCIDVSIYDPNIWADHTHPDHPSISYVKHSPTFPPFLDATVRISNETVQPITFDPEGYARCAILDSSDRVNTWLKSSGPIRRNKVGGKIGAGPSNSPRRRRYPKPYEVEGKKRPKQLRIAKHEAKKVNQSTAVPDNQYHPPFTEMVTDTNPPNDLSSGIIPSGVQTGHLAYAKTRKILEGKHTHTSSAPVLGCPVCIKCVKDSKRTAAEKECYKQIHDILGPYNPYYDTPRREHALVLEDAIIHLNGGNLPEAARTAKEENCRVVTTRKEVERQRRRLIDKYIQMLKQLVPPQSLTTRNRPRDRTRLDALTDVRDILASSIGCTTTIRIDIAQ